MKASAARRRHDGKQRFETLKKAQSAAHSMAKRKAKSGAPIVTFLRAYGCHCGGYHFGKTKQIDWELIASLSAPKKGDQ